MVTKTEGYLGAAVLDRTPRHTASMPDSGATTHSRVTESNSMVRHPMAEALAWAVAILSAIAAVAGLFWSTLYKDAPFWIQQARGIDLATLLLAVPILVVGLLLLRRGWQPAMSVVIGVLLYDIYNYTIYSTSVAMNRLSFVYIAILGLCVWSLIQLALPVATTSSVVLRMDTSVARVVGGFLLAVVVLFGLLWLSQIATTTFTGVAPTDVNSIRPPGESGLRAGSRDLPSTGRDRGDRCLAGSGAGRQLRGADAALGIPDVCRGRRWLPVCGSRW